MYLYQKGDFESMRKDTLEFAKEKYFNGHSDTRSVQENFDLLISFIQDSADKHIPSKTSRSVSSIPWITPEDQDQDSLLVKRRNDNHSPGPVIRELVPSSHQRSELGSFRPILVGRFGPGSFRTLSRFGQFSLCGIIFQQITKVLNIN